MPVTDFLFCSGGSTLGTKGLAHAGQFFFLRPNLPFWDARSWVWWNLGSAKKAEFFFRGQAGNFGTEGSGSGRIWIVPKSAEFFLQPGKIFFSWVLPDPEKSGGYPAENMLFRRLQCTFCVFLEGLL